MDGFVIHNDRIEECVYQFCIEHDIKSIKEATQNEYMACLLYVRKKLFPGKELKHDNGYWNIDLLSELLDYLIEFTLMNNKVLTIMAFCSFTGVSYEVYSQWSNIDTKYRDMSQKILSNTHYDLTQKLRRYAEESTQSLLTDKSKNPVGAMAILNHRYGWNVIAGVNNKKDATPQLAARDELEKLAANNKPVPALPKVD